MDVGFSVTGFFNTKKIWSNAGLKEGDRLILTKPLGTGTITSGIKLGRSSPEAVQDAIVSMCMLNRVPEILQHIEISAATDITGFGLAGHALQMARASAVTVEIDTQGLPIL
jgi:selenide,water dikinase